MVDFLLALVREMREVEVLKADTFEQSLMEATSMVDEEVTMQRDQLAKMDQDLMQRLRPTG